MLGERALDVALLGGLGQLSAKLVTALLARAWAAVSICMVSTLRDQPRSTTLAAYQSRCAVSLTLSRKVQRWNHGNCAARCCTNSRSGHA